MNREEKSKVLALVEEGLSNREVARRLGRSEGAVRYVRNAAAALLLREGRRGQGGGIRHTHALTPC